MLVHATTVDLAGLGVLIFGEPGAGKSDLALRLIAQGALLVADDQTEVEVADGGFRAHAPRTIAGLLEARGLGIVPAPLKRATRLKLAVSLIFGAPERMPESRAWSLPGHTMPQIRLIELNAFEASAAEKVRRALGPVTTA
jgi:serine kinase of HPr protein (carbohydrate metabolism regulator)